MKRVFSVLFLLAFFFGSNLFAQSSAALDTVSIELKWYHQFQFAGYYAAVEQGFYEDEGLYVHIIEGSLESDQVQNVVNGMVDFGLFDSGLIVDAANGLDVVAINAIFQYSPYVLAARSDRGYVQLSDLAEARIMAGDNVGREELLTLFRELGIDTNDIEFVDFDYYGFIGDTTVDVIHGYVTAEISTVIDSLVDVDIFYPWKYGIDFYGDILFTNGEFLEESREIVDAFSRATLAGWAYARENPDEIIDYILTLPSVQERSITRAMLLTEAEKTWEYSIPERIPIGFMTEERWRVIGDFYMASGLINDVPNLESFLIQPQLSFFEKNIDYIPDIIFGLGIIIVVVAFSNEILRSEVKKKTQRAIDEFEERRKFQEKYEELITNIHDCVFSIDQNGIFRYMSPRVTAITGFLPEECIDTIHPPFVKKENQLKLVNRLRYRIETGIDDRKPICIQHKNGEELWVKSSTRVQKNEQGTLLIVGTFRDITKQVLAKQALDVSEARYQNMVNNISECVLSLEKDGTINFISQSITKINGLEPVEVLAINFFDLIFKDDQEDIFEAFENITDEFPITVQFRVQHRLTQGLRWVEANFLITQNHEDTPEILGTLEDVSEKRFALNALERSEQRFRTLSEKAPVGIFMLLPNEYVFVNQKYLDVFGATSREMLGDQLNYECIHEEDRDHLVKSVQDLFSGKKEEAQHVYRGKTYGGKPIVLEYFTTTIVLASQRILFGTVIDITAEHAAKKDLMDAFVEKEVILAEVHHRVKNNMALITSLIELQRMEIDNDVADLILREAQLRIHTIAAVHEQLYDHESFMEIPFKKYLHNLIDSTVTTISPNLKKVSVNTDMDELKININYSIPIALFINEALTNCLRHAFIGKKKGVINIRLKKECNNRIMVCVSDNGVGFNAEPELYTSLGMTLIRNLAMQVSGDLIIMNNDEGGSKVELFFDVTVDTATSAGRKI